MLKRLVYLPIIAALLWLGGCISGGRSGDAQFHMLTARAQSDGGAALDTTVGVGPVRVAPFLARPPIVTHAGGSTLSVRENQRWGEPLDQGIQRVLLQNLETLTGARTHGFPWRQRAAPAYAVRLDVQDLDRLDDGTAVLEVSWMLEDLQRGALLHTQRERITAPGAGNYGALAGAYSELLAELARRIAASIDQAAAAGQRAQSSLHSFQY